MACFQSLSDNRTSVCHGRVVGRVTTSWCICWASERVKKFWRRGSEFANWIVPSNQGKTLTFAFPLNQSRQRKSPPFRGNLFDVWMSKCVRPLPKHIHAFRALGRVWVFRPSSCWKTFFKSLFPPCRLLGSQGWTSSRASWSTVLFFLMILLHCMSLNSSGEGKQIFQNSHQAPNRSLTLHWPRGS